MYMYVFEMGGGCVFKSLVFSPALFFPVTSGACPCAKIKLNLGREGLILGTGGAASGAHSGVKAAAFGGRGPPPLPVCCCNDVFLPSWLGLGGKG